MQWPEFIRRKYLLGGAIGAAVVCLVVPADSWAAKCFLAVFSWGFVAYGLWSMREGWGAVVETGQDIAGWWRDRQRARQRAREPREAQPPPELPAEVQAQVRQVLAVMASHGLFKPQVPDAELLFPGLARNEGQARPDDILDALVEAQGGLPAGSGAPWTGNLVVEDSHGEQEEDALRRQVEDLVRLSEGALAVHDLHISVRSRPDDERECDVQLRMRVLDETVELAYPGHIKYLSTHIQHALATRLRALGTGKRLAWLDMGERYALSVLADGAVPALNKALRLGPRSTCRWAWVDELEPESAGEPPPAAAAK